MSRASEFAYLDTRVSLFANHLLDEAGIEHLLSSSGSAEAAPEGLGSHIGLNGDDELASIDRTLMPQLLSELSVLLRSVSGDDRHLLRYWANRFEISNIKTLLRGKMTGQGMEALHAQLSDLGPFSRIPLDALLMSSDVAELLRLLEDTVYADIARDVRRSFDQQQELFTIDASIDRRYFAGLSRRAMNCSSDARTLVGSVIDRVNLAWLLRYRFAYGLPPSQAYYLLVPAGHKLGRQHLLQLSQLEDLKQVLDNLPQPFAGILDGARSTSEVIRRMERHTWSVAQHILRHSRFNPSRALAYMILRERDLRRVRAIVRSRHLGMDDRMLRIATGLDSADQLERAEAEVA